ncbi:WD40 repeat domain-containing protein [Candidatus Symbiobacter mobilis]|uniref:NTPase-like protein n=1 Tax=Candidatus Symbiobacter mobilis CR TaxID=946483 RepID=U5N4Y1_9BURK|nr:WD40 repeat domain-containing protein [Candidatus Symbiobacter mobilis]AGX86377.1 NTPase-like protein [Candidatus Symbiobacter mobilis CR]
MNATPTPDSLSRERPWPGLAAYTEADSAYFFGREAEAEDLTRRIRRERLTVLFGQSGLGKTSLLQAGLFPRLRAVDLQPIYLRLDYTTQARPLAQQVLAEITAVIQREALDAPLPQPDEGLWDYFHRRDLEWWSARNRLLTPVLVFDQFEEIFTLGRADAQRSQTFLDELADLIENRQPDQAPADGQDNGQVVGKLLLSFREDFLPDFEALKGRIHSLFLNRLRLERLSGSAACKVLEDSGGQLLAPGLAENIVRFVAAEKKPRPLQELTIEPALLSVVCRELNERRISRHADQIGADMLELGQHEILRELVARALIHQPAALVEGLEEHLLTDGGHRAQYPLQDLMQRTGVGRDAIQGLVTQRILRMEPRGDVEWLELTHDLLAPVVRENRDRRREAVEREKNRRKLKRMWAFAGAMVVLVLVMAGLSWKMFEAREETAIALAESRKQQALAHAQAKVVLARSLAMQANEILGGRSAYPWVLGSLLALEAHAIAPDFVTRGALLNARQRNEVPSSVLFAGTIIIAVAYSPDGKVLASGSADNTVRLWDVATRKPLGEPLRGHEDIVSSVAFSPDGKVLASGSLDKTVRLWDVATREPLGEPLRGHEADVKSVAFSPDGKVLASGSDDKTVRLWDVATRKPLGEPLRGHEAEVSSVAFSPDGKVLASGSWDKTVRLWDVATRKPLGEPLRGHEESVRSVAFSPDGKVLASGSWDKTVRLWDVATRKPLGEPLRGHEADVYSITFSPDGKVLASGSMDETVRLWDVATRKPLGEPLRGHEADVYSITFSPDGKVLASGSMDDTVRLWDVATRKPLGEPLRGHEADVYSITFSPDGKVLASGSWDDTVRLWDVATRKPLGEPLGHEKGVNSVAFSPDGKVLASGSMDETVRLWDVATHKPLGEPLRGHEADVSSVAYSPDGKVLASGSLDKTVRLWDVATRKPLGEPLGHEDWVTSVAYSPDGKVLASGSDDNTVQLWDVATHKPLGEPLRGHEADVNSVAFSPDGKVLASGSHDSTVRLWDVATRKPLGEPLRGHEDIVSSVAFSPDGKVLASGSVDKTVRLWDVATRKPLGEPLRGYESLVTSVAFSPDGKVLASGSWDHTVLLWDINQASWRDHLCQCVGRNLTRAEWQEFLGDLLPYRKTCPNLPLDADR